MSRLIYEKSVSSKGHLIIPFMLGKIDSVTIYSYKLLSGLGDRGKFHKADNPQGIYSDNISRILDIAKEHLEQYSDLAPPKDYFKARYTYRENLIIIYDEKGRYFYDHYKPDSLVNLAAPKLFKSEQACITWVKQGLDRSNPNEKIENA